MASLVAPLVSGISTAASGSVSFLLQGTATVAPVYSDPEGVTAVTSHTLDARGAIVRYVEARVDVIVLDSNGGEVVRFTWGTDARDARVENAGWTGPDATGATVAGGRITVDTVLTRLRASLGTTDGNVDVNGVAQTLSAAISSSAGLVYNVKSPAYGAEGDGATDDSGAIQAAINAAATAGGGILYFPHGTYLCNTGLVVGSGEGKFTYLGESATGSKLKQVGATTLLTLGANNNNLLLGLTFTATAANTGSLVSIGSAARATFLGCAFDPIDGNHLLLAASTSVATLLNCSLSQAGASSRVVSVTAGSPIVRFEACDIATAGADMTTFGAARINLIGCAITMGSAIAAGTTQLASGATMSIIGGVLESLYTSGTVSVANGGGSLMFCGGRIVSGSTTLALVGATSTPTLYEAACDFASSNVVLSAGGFNGHSATRDHRTTVQGSATTSYTPSGEFMVHEVVSSGASMTFNNPVPAVPVGSALVILWKNNSGVDNITPAFGTSYSFVSGPNDVDNGRTGVYVFTPRAGNGTITTDLICFSPPASGGATL